MFGHAIKKAIEKVHNISNLCIIGNQRYTKYLNIEELMKLQLIVHQLILDDLSFNELESKVEGYGKDTVLILILPLWVKDSSRAEIFNWFMSLEMKGMYIINISVGLETVDIDEKIENSLVTLLGKVIAADNKKMEIYNFNYFDTLKYKNRYVIDDSNGSCISFDVEKILVENDFLDINNKVIQIPAGEVFVVPQKGSVNGTLHIQEKKGMRYITIKNDFADLSYIEEELYLPVCEVGFGTNPQVPNIRNLPYTEKKYGTFHLGFGNNSNFGGGYIYSIHFDIVSNSKEFNIKMYEDNYSKTN